MGKSLQKSSNRKRGNRAISSNTQEKIKIAAHKLFLSKGFSATTTRDVAKAAGINLALVNYYFRTKKNLFDVIMQEKIQNLLSSIIPIFNDTSASLDQKIERIVSSYIDFLTIHPDLPTFILNEIKKSGFEIIAKEKFYELVTQSSFMRQLKEENNNINPVHLFISLLGMMIFPFVARPILLKTGLLNEAIFHNLMEERKVLIPAWMKAMRDANANPLTV